MTDAEIVVDENDFLFLPLGGSDEIGMNLNLYHFGGKWLMVDLGITFGDETTPGIDIIMPDPDFIERRRDDLAGLILTHGHEDHIGAVPYLWDRLRCPIFATPFTASLVRRKLADVDLLGQVDLVEVPLSGNFVVGPFEIELIGLTHSIPEPNGVVLRCGGGTVFHTGDWKFDPQPQIGDVTDHGALEALAEEGVLALIGDSTNVDVPGRTGSEAELVDSFMELFSTIKGRIAVTCFASNIARLRSVAVAAEKNGRHTALVGRSLWRMFDVARENGYLLDVPEFITESDIGHIPDNRLVMICTGSQGEPRAALSRIVDQTHRNVSMGPGDTVIFSSREIPGNEKAIGRLQSRLITLGATVVTERDHHVHVSGHPAHDDLVEMYQTIRPQIAIPVHGEARHLTEHAKLARACQVPTVLIPENGSILKLAPGVPEIVGTVAISSLALDGSRIRQLDSATISDRRRMLHNGTVAVTVVLDQSGVCRDLPQLSVTGIFDCDDRERDDSRLADLVRNTVDGLPARARRSDQSVVEAVRRAASRMVRTEFGKRPLTSVHVVRT